MRTQAFSPATRPSILHPSHRIAIAAICLAMCGLFLGIAVLLPNPLPVLAVAPDYSLTDQDGITRSSANLRGQIVVYDFVYTSCTTVCPAITGQMLQVQNRLAARGWLSSEVVLVTITFDPERDTPGQLKAYAAQMGAEPEGWIWLTSDPIEIKQLVGGEFGVYFEKVDTVQAGHAHSNVPAGGYDFIHDVLFVLVDDQGRVRAEYNAFPGIEQITRDISLLVREKNAAGTEQYLWRLSHLLRESN